MNTFFCFCFCFCPSVRPSVLPVREIFRFDQRTKSVLITQITPLIRMMTNSTLITCQVKKLRLPHFFVSLSSQHFDEKALTQIFTFSSRAAGTSVITLVTTRLTTRPGPDSRAIHLFSSRPIGRFRPYRPLIPLSDRPDSSSYKFQLNFLRKFHLWKIKISFYIFHDKRPFEFRSKVCWLALLCSDFCFCFCSREADCQ